MDTQEKLASTNVSGKAPTFQEKATGIYFILTNKTRSGGNIGRETVFLCDDLGTRKIGMIYPE